MKKLNINDVIEIDICKPNRGKFPIGRYQGKICKLTLGEGLKFVEYGSTVKARVAVINDKSLHVLVEAIVRTAESNENIISKKLELLKESQKQKPVKHIPTKKGAYSNFRW